MSEKLITRWRMSSTGLEPHQDGEWVRYADMGGIAPDEVFDLGDRRVVVCRVFNSVIRDYRGRIAVRDTGTGRLSYVSEQRLVSAREATR